MKILLSYSKFHFNPSIDMKKNPYSNSGTSINCRAFYEVLSELGSVDYIDFSEWEKVKGKSYDLFIGINHNFDNILQNCDIKISVYYAVNQHPSERNKILKDFAQKYHPFCNLKKFVDVSKLNYLINSDYVYELAPNVKNINFADYIILVGNDIVTQSYVRNGFPFRNIYSLNFELNKGKASSKKNFNDIPKFLYIATELCMRKGYDIVYELILKLSKLYKNQFKLIVIGKNTFKYYDHKNNLLQKKLKDNFEYYTFLNEKEYYEKIKEADFYLFPSLEEGQAGTVLDAIYNGIIPIITKESGVNFSPLGYLDANCSSKKNIDILKTAMQLSDESKHLLSQDTADYYNKEHLGFKNKLKLVIKEILEKGPQCPKFQL